MTFLFSRPKPYYSSRERMHDLDVYCTNGDDPMVSPVNGFTRCITCLAFYGPMDLLGPDMCPKCLGRRKGE